MIFRASKKISPRHLVTNAKGGPLAEYMPLLAGIGMLSIVAINTLGFDITSIFRTTSDRLATNITGPGGPGGSGNGSGGPGGAGVIPGSLISPTGGFCPPSGWSYSPVNDYYWVPGVVTQRPVLELFDLVTTEWDPPTLPQPALGADYMDKMYINSAQEQLHWPDHVHPILIGWHAFRGRYVVPANAIEPPAADCPAGNDGSGGVGAGGPTPPSGGGTLMGTPGDDTLNLNGIDREVIGLAGNDTITGWGAGSIDEIFNAGPGDDDIRGGEGSDTYIFEPGHGTDYVLDFTGGNDVFFFEDMYSFEMSVTPNGNDLRIETSPGNIINWAGPLRLSNASIYMIEDMVFEDRTISGRDLVQMGVQQSVENASAGSNLMTTPYNDTWVIRSSTPSVNIYDNLSNDDTLVFPDHNLSEVTFSYAGGGASSPSVRINLPGGNSVFINRHAQFTTRSVENMIFRDQVVTEADFREKYIRDQQATGEVIGLSGGDIYTWAPGQTPYTIYEVGGSDIFDLTSTARSEWTFASNNANFGQESLLMDHVSGARLVVRETYNSSGRQIESFQFSDQTLTWAQMAVIAPR